MGEGKECTKIHNVEPLTFIAPPLNLPTYAVLNKGVCHKQSSPDNAIGLSFEILLLFV